MRFYLALISISLSHLINAQVNIPCNTWMNLPSYQSYATVGDLDITGNKMTIEAVFMRTAPYGPTYIWAGDLVTKHVDPVDINYLLRPNNAEITTTNGYVNTPPICEIELNKVYHVALVYNGSTLKFYRNGFLMASVPATGNLAQNDHLTKIGYYDASFHNTNLIGYINEVRIWNVERTQAQIRSSMFTTLSSPATQAGLLAYYQFDNLLNKQGNTTWNATLGGTASINSTIPVCNFFTDSCSSRSNTGSIINDYAPILSLNKCENKITLDNASAFRPGDTVLMIQMKGAEINSSNSTAFGSVTSARNAGNYEFNYIRNITGNEVELKNTITRDYQVPDGKVQLVRVPYYQNVFVASTLTCLPWDGTKGGVLVLNAADSIVLNADIDVSGKGFRGGNDPTGTPPDYNCYANEFYYPVNPVLASEKGEGISVTDPAKSYGKGAYSNGGGGGNSHNSGGGGGANSGPGGTGGYSYEGSPCNATVPFDNRGIGGYANTYSNALNKIHPGGGGGAGHTNSAEGFEARGGNGAGIIILRADKLRTHNFRILANGNAGAECGNTGLGCHEGMGGGGGGGSIIADINEYVGTTVFEAKGGKGADMKATGIEKVGPGGGGGGGITWLSNPALPALVTVNTTGGVSGVSTANAGNAWGASAGQPGTTIFNLSIPEAATLFKKNIDSVRFDHIPTSCSAFDFEGRAYTNSATIATWEWNFGDGNSAGTQNASHSYSVNGTYTAKLIATDINGCKDSITKEVTAGNLNFDYNHKADICSNPLSVQFTGLGSATQSPYWSFGDGNDITGINSPLHVYGAEGTYTVKYSVSNGACSDTVTKSIFVGILKDDIIITPDTTICAGTAKQLRSVAALDFCWSPATFLDNPLSPNPVTNTPDNLKYYFTASIEGASVITNGDFNGGNTGFSSEYIYAANNTTEGQYFVGNNPQSWNPGVSNCKDHTTTSGNMLMVNGSPTPDAVIWKQTINILPNTTYAFSSWIQSLSVQNPAQLQFSVNDNNLGDLIVAGATTCSWQKFFTTWNSGSASTATISIVNKNVIAAGNDFALDDISFSPVITKRDSVLITVDKPVVNATNNTSVCEGSSIQLIATGASTYSWTGNGLSNPSIFNPVATPLIPTRYIVTGITSNGCVAKDTVDIGINPKPVITKSANDTVCAGSSIQLFASGGVEYLWSPAASLNDPASANPLASPSVSTRYYVTVTDANQCSNIDSVQVFVRSVNDFFISPSMDICKNDTLQLSASGGHLYSWSPAITLIDPLSETPRAFPQVTTTYTAVITDTICDVDHELRTIVNVLPQPILSVNKENDIDCVVPSSKLYVAGANKYNWFPATGLSNVISQSPVASPAISTMYYVTGTDSRGCRNTDSIMVNVTKDSPGLYLMPTAFTPNGDGINDCYGIKYWGQVEELDFSIFNRWGERVFHTTSASDCWDGMYKGAKQSSQVFIYMIRASTACEKGLFRKGTFTLIR